MVEGSVLIRLVGIGEFMTQNKWFLLILTGFLLCTMRLVNRDFYYDELHTMDNFLFCPVVDVVTKYVNLNNHVIYSLINNIYLRVLGVHDIETLLRNPWIIRIPQLIFPIGTLWLVWKFRKD